jgi:tetratricopeptide (TPR) repeat protein
LLGLTLIETFAASCAWRDPNVRKQEFYQSAVSYFEKGKYPEAAIQLQNAIQIDPKYADAHYKLAQCDKKLGMWAEAFAELNRTVDLAPRNWQAQIDLGNGLLAARQFRQAQDKAYLVLAAEPQNVEAHTLLANANAALGNPQSSLEEMQRAIRLDPNRSSSYINLAMLLVNAQQPLAAEESYKQAIALGPKSPAPAMALGAFYAGQRRFQEAEQQFRNAIGLDPKSPAARAALARVYLADEKENDAVEVLKQAKQAFSGNSDGYRMLGEFYAQSGQMDKAIEEYASLYHDHPKDLQVSLNYLQLLIGTNRLEEATKLNDKILNENPKSTEAIFAKGQIWVRQGRANDAIALFQSALKTDPKNALGHYSLGLAYAQAGYLEQAHMEWQQAVKLQPDLVRAQAALAQLGLQQNNLDEAAQSAGALIALQPASAGGYNVRAVVEARRHDLVAAEADLKKAIEVAPHDPLAYTRLARVRIVQKKYPEAEALYDQALGQNPAFTEALGGLLQTYVQEKKPANVLISRIQEQITRAPNNSAYYLMLGQAFNGLRDFEKAQNALEKAVEIDHNNVNALLMLADTQAARGSLAQALATAERAVQQNSRAVQGYAVLGVLEEKAGNWQKAEETYQKVMRIDPGYGVGANNLASLLLDHGGDVKVALSLAQTARHSLPDSPNTADTLAWAYIQTGVYWSAISLLQEALTQTPDNPTYRYHLGVAYQRTKNPAAAAGQFRQVLKLDPGYVKGEEIRKYLADLSKS